MHANNPPNSTRNHQAAPVLGFKNICRVEKQAGRRYGKVYHLQMNRWLLGRVISCRSWVVIRVFGGWWYPDTCDPDCGPCLINDRSEDAEEGRDGISSIWNDVLFWCPKAFSGDPCDRPINGPDPRARISAWVTRLVRIRGMSAQRRFRILSILFRSRVTAIAPSDIIRQDLPRKGHRLWAVARATSIFSLGDLPIQGRSRSSALFNNSGRARVHGG